MADDRSMTMAENTEQYTPTDDHMRSLFCQGYAQGDFDKHGQAWAAWDRFITAHDARVRGEAVREAREYIELLFPRGPVSRDAFLADLAMAETRFEGGIHANGRNRADRIEQEARR